MNAPLKPAPLDAAQGRRMADAIRVLAAEAVQQANSGHPGAPLGMAEMATTLWSRHLKHNPADPRWPDRDRFVLSNGHASMLLYALLHLSGYDLTADDLRRFRQLHSRTPGHPEVDVTPGVETTTGPLGQGLANAVGMALAESLLAAEFNRDGFPVIDHLTWVFTGDGCLMEGISQEAISLAGTLGLGKLVVLYDDNGISIDGEVSEWFADDTPARFASAGWQVIGPIDGHDPVALDIALHAAAAQARQPGAKPTLIDCRTTIGKGAVGQEGSAEVHGAPLGAAGVAALKAALHWTAAPFEVPEALRAAWDAREAGAARQAAWQAMFGHYAQAHPALAAEFTRRQQGRLPADWAQQADAAVQALAALRASGAKPVATRRASQLVLDALAPGLPELLGGSADLTGSNLTDFQGHHRAGPRRAGNYLSWGVREFGMAAALNGVALHGGLLPYGGTFLTFSDYSRNAIRMAALMRRRVVHVFTHDSIGLGEDGPTHQPVEHVASLRLIPNLEVWRPADGVETAVAWIAALERSDGPSALVLTRQALPAVADVAQRDDIARGAYVLSDAPAGQRPQAVVIATGSEVALALEAQRRLQAEEGLAIRVVSMPCTQRFDAQGDAWCDQVLPPGLPVIAVEAGHPDGWRRYTGRSGAVIGIAHFGESAPGPQLMAQFGFTAERVMDEVRRRVPAFSAAPA
jgi:transketolase